jgi:hypothetical protein
VEERVPLVAVAVPAAEVVDACAGSGGHLLLEGGVVGELLEAVGEGCCVAVGDDEALDSVGEEVFGAGCGGGDDRATAGHGLALDEGEALLDAGKDEDVAAGHEACQLGLGDVSGEGYIFGGEGREERAEVVLHTADQGEVFARMAQAGEGFEEVGDSFAQTDLAGEEDFEGIGGGWFGWGEAVEADAVGDDVEFFGGDSLCQEGATGDVGGDGDGVGEGVDGLFAADDVVGRRSVGEMPAAMLLGHDFKLESLVG